MEEEVKEGREKDQGELKKKKKEEKSERHSIFCFEQTKEPAARARKHLFELRSFPRASLFDVKSGVERGREQVEGARVVVIWPPISLPLPRKEPEARPKKKKVERTRERATRAAAAKEKEVRSDAGNAPGPFSSRITMKRMPAIEGQGAVVSRAQEVTENGTEETMFLLFFRGLWLARLFSLPLGAGTIESKQPRSSLATLYTLFRPRQLGTGRTCLTAEGGKAGSGKGGGRRDPFSFTQKRELKFY